MKNKLSTSGFSLVEIMIAVGLGGAAMLGVSNLLRMNQEVDKKSQIITSWQVHKLRTMSAINSKEGCENTLINNGEKKLGDVNFNIFDRSNKEVLKNDSMYPTSTNPLYNVKSTEIVDLGTFSGDADLHVAEIKIELEYLQNKFGSNESNVAKTFTSTTKTGFKLIVSADPVTKKIKGCYGRDNSFDEQVSCESLLGGILVDLGDGNFRCVSIAGFQGKSTFTANNTTLGQHALANNDNAVANAALGNNALRTLSAGGGNSAAGYNSLAMATNALFNSAAGYGSLDSITTGSGNVGIGSIGVLGLIEKGLDNTAIGAFSGAGHTSTVNSTVSIGYAAQGDPASGSIQDGTVAIGSFALYANSKGSGNNAIGYSALYNNFIGRENTAIGHEAMKFSDPGFDNTAVGFRSLYRNTTGYYNTAIGKESLFSNQTGISNTAIGHHALSANVAGIYNTSIGAWSMRDTENSGSTAVGGMALLNDHGMYNTAVGFSSLQKNQGGTDNTAIGISSLENNTDGMRNTAIGSDTLIKNVDGNDNVALGVGALANATKGSSVAIGYHAAKNFVGFNNTSGTVAIGYEAFEKADDNTGVAIGLQAMKENAGSYNVVGLGYQTGSNLTNTQETTYIGYKAGQFANFTGGLAVTDNVGIGYRAMYQAQTMNSLGIGQDVLYSAEGDENVAIGVFSMGSHKTGIRNVAIGGYNMNVNQNDGDDNLAIGYGSLNRISTGEFNTCFGYQACNVLKTGKYNVFMGANAGNSWDSEDDNFNIFIGSTAAACHGGTLNNTLVITSAKYGDGITCPANDNPLLHGKLDSNSNGSNETSLGIGGTYDSSYRLKVYGEAFQDNGSGASWTMTSDIRLKDFVGYYDKGIDQIKKINLVKYHYNELAKSKGHNTSEINIGVIAQEILPLFPEAVSIDNQGFYVVNVEPLRWANINAIKEQYKQIQSNKLALSKNKIENESTIYDLNKDVENINVEQQILRKQLHNLISEIKNKKNLKEKFKRKDLGSRP